MGKGQGGGEFNLFSAPLGRAGQDALLRPGEYHNSVLKTSFGKRQIRQYCVSHLKTYYTHASSEPPMRRLFKAAP